MMEPVARINAEALKELEKHPGASATVWSGKASHQFAKGAVPLVRLSDAEARIAELQAKIEWLELEAEGHENAKRDLAEILNCADEPRWKYMRHEAVKLKARAEAAEARIEAERQAAIDRAEVELLKMTEDYAKEVERRADAEALLKEVGKALEPFAKVVEHDISTGEDDRDVFRPMPAQYARAKRITVGHLRAARAIHDKIGVKDE